MDSTDEELILEENQEGNTTTSGSEIDEDLEEELVDHSIYCLAAHAGVQASSGLPLHAW